MEIIVGVSNRHVHVTEEDLKILFGENANLENIKDLKQPGQFASNFQVSIETEKAILSKVRILGPCREYTQVELSKTDCFTLGIKAPVRSSGSLEGAAEVTIVGSDGSIKKECAIIADRHIHIDKETREKLNLQNREEVSMRVSGEKSAILEHVKLKESDSSFFELHLDTDDANACLVKQNDIVEIIL